MAAKGQQTEACHVQKDAAPKEVRYLKYLYCIDEDCSHGRTCQYLNAADGHRIMFLQLC